MSLGDNNSSDFGERTSIVVRCFKAQFGFGLAELLVSTLLGSLLIASLLTAYCHVRRQYLYVIQRVEAIYDLQRMIDYIRMSIRPAGFTPCMRVDRLVSADARTGNRSLSAFMIDSANSRLSIYRMSEHFERVIVHSERLEVLTQAKTRWYPGQYVIVADCYHAEVHSIRQIHAKNKTQTIELAEPLIFTYEQPVYFGEWIEASFYLKSTALYYQKGRSEVLSQQVQQFNLQHQYQHPYDVITFDLRGLGERLMHVATRIRAI